MEKDPKNYEVAYLLSPTLSDEEALSWAGKLTAAIEETHGTIRKVEEPKKRMLAYPVKKEKSAHFGWTTFQTAPGNIELLQKKIGVMESVLRHMVMEEEIIPEKRPMLRTTLRSVEGRQPAGAVLREEEKVEEKLDLEQLDKKLEEILGK